MSQQAEKQPSGSATAELSRPLSGLLRVLTAIERVGNKLPHPFWLFWILAGVLVLLSWLLAALQVSAVSPTDNKVIAVRSLVSIEGVKSMLTDAITNYVTFPPLGTIVVVLLGVAIADKAGLVTAALRGGLAKVPARWVTFALAFAGMVSHVITDAAYVVLIPLGALIYRAIGRNPIMGIVVAFVSVSAGFDASPLVTPLDAILSGLTTVAARFIDPTYLVTPLGNYYFSLGSSVILAVVITIVAETVVAKQVESEPLDPEDDVDADSEADLSDVHLRPEERRGMRNAGVATLVFFAAVIVAALPTGSPLRGENGAILNSPLLLNIAVVIALYFAVVGVVYGIAAGTVTRTRDVPDFMNAGIRDLVPVLVLFFAVSQFLAYFKWTQIGPIIAIRGAGLLRDLGVSGPVLFAGLLVLVTIINLLITSGSAQWTLVAPIFVPMFMLLDIPPETTQALYRIADSCTNAITPMSPYFAMTLTFVQRYRKTAGIGTLAALTVPLALTMLVVWTLFFYAWWALGIPLGPGAPVR
ncbi:AbgT family transporter [Actinomycetes bacterium KLBMP 9759]